MLNPDRLHAHRIEAVEEAYDPRDAILYALGVGAGLADFDETHLVFERGLTPLPTLALTLGTPGFWPMDPALGWDWPMILHGRQSLRLFRPLKVPGRVVGQTIVTDIADKGQGKAALVRAVRTLKTLSGAIIAVMEETWILRGAGGFGGARDLSPRPMPPAPDGPPAFAIDLPTSQQQAMLYRLSGDRNPLHIHAATAQGAGFDRPILHGLSTMGVIARAIVHGCAGDDPARLTGIELRFAAPVFPGETIRTEIWQEGNKRISFRASVPARGIVVADQGVAMLDDFSS